MPSDLKELAEVHLSLCELLESPILTSGTRAQVQALKDAIQHELEAMKEADSVRATEA